MEGTMSALAKPSSIVSSIAAPAAGPADSLDLLRQLRAAIMAARTRLREWHYRIESRNELRLNADLIARDAACSHYDVAMELKKPFWRA
jgi:uncharacterized protein YjiS (DUF1127 family)